MYEMFLRIWEQITHRLTGSNNKAADDNNIKFYSVSSLGVSGVFFLPKTKLDQTHMRRENLPTGGGGQV